jgi:hypothetical protein
VQSVIAPLHQAAFRAEAAALREKNIALRACLHEADSTAAHWERTAEHRRDEVERLEAQVITLKQSYP